MEPTRRMALLLLIAFLLHAVNEMRLTAGNTTNTSEIKNSKIALVALRMTRATSSLEGAQRLHPTPPGHKPLEFRSVGDLNMILDAFTNSFKLAFLSFGYLMVLAVAVRCWLIGPPAVLVNIWEDPEGDDGDFFEDDIFEDDSFGDSDSFDDDSFDDDFFDDEEFLADGDAFFGDGGDMSDDDAGDVGGGEVGDETVMLIIGDGNLL